MKNFRLIVLLATFIIVATITVARAYTFDGDFDPKEIFTYPMVSEPQRVNTDLFILLLKDVNKQPQCVVTCVRIAQGRITVVAYVYYDKDMKFRHFQLNREGHYKEGLPDVDTVIFLEKLLYKLHGFSGV